MITKMSAFARCFGLTQAFRYRLASCLLVTVAVSGCVQRSPFIDSHFGAAVSIINAQQIMNPEASHNTDPVLGLDAKAAQSAYDQYQRSYKAPEPSSNAFTIGIGGQK